MKNNENKKITLNDFILANAIYNEIKEKEEEKKKDEYDSYQYEEEELEDDDYYFEDPD